MKTIRGLATVKLMVAVLFSTCLFSSLAHAQSTFKGKFHLVEEARWENTVLPTGEYTLTIESPQMPLRALVRAADGKTAAMFSTRIIEDAQGGASSIFITNHGGERKVRFLNLPQLGFSLIYEPLTESEQKELDVAAAQAVPVAMAKK